KLYKLIWNRFVASQMLPAVYDRTTVDIDAKPSRPSPAHAAYVVRASGRILKFAGWLQVTEGQREFAGEDESRDEGKTAYDHLLEDRDPFDAGGVPAAPARVEEEPAEALLPEIEEGVQLTLATPPGVTTEQKFTQPPARYNEGSLVRELEKRG